MEKHINRLIDNTIAESLKEAGCVVIEGIKWCGKSTSARRFAKTIIDLEISSVLEKYQIYTTTGDSSLLLGDSPLIFDEWQKIPSLWDYIRAEIDERGGKGHFIITNSVKPIEDKNRHSGIGRMKHVILRPLSLWESSVSIGNVSLSELFNTFNYKISGRSKHNLLDIAKLICRGGWPEVINESNEIVVSILKNYIDEIVSIKSLYKNSIKASVILRSYARLISTSSPISNIVKDLELIQIISDVRTVESYIAACRKLFVIEDLDAWLPTLSSDATVRNKGTRQFVDPSIATTILDKTPNDLINDLNTFEVLFKSLVIRDLRIYSEVIDGNVYNYRDSTGLEVDAIVHLDNGKWGAIEITLGGEDTINKGAKKLHLLKNKVNTDEMNEPSFLLVITATGLSYRRDDGVYVVPIGCLKN